MIRSLLPQFFNFLLLYLLHFLDLLGILGLVDAIAGPRVPTSDHSWHLDLISKLAGDLILLLLLKLFDDLIVILGNE